MGLRILTAWQLQNGAPDGSALTGLVKMAKLSDVKQIDRKRKNFYY